MSNAYLTMNYMWAKRLNNMICFLCPSFVDSYEIYTK